jgi:pimeloyl-ACP methyl ester carboxylesterase
MGRAFLALFVLALAFVPPAARTQEAEPETMGRRIFVFGFNSWGELTTPGELELAEKELGAAEDVDRIVIVSYGWAYDAESSYSSYLGVVRDLTGGAGLHRTAVIGVGWDSSITGFRRLANDVLPLPGVANAISWLPDHLLFPLSFWSKAAQADRIGFGGLRTSLNRLFSTYEGREKHPTVVLIGHSFGTRVVSALVLENLGILPVRAEPFVAAKSVQSMVLFQPASVPANLFRDAPYPVVATMSRHDHANGLLFPLANLPLNAFGFTAFEALLRGPVELARSSVGLAVRRVDKAIPGGDGQPEPPGPAADDESSRDFEMLRQLPGHGEFVLRRTLIELAAVPAALAFTVVATPLNYVYVQGHGLVHSPVGHVLDTLAQLPLVEIPVDALGWALGRKVPFGQRSKGFLGFGPVLDPVGRLLSPVATGPALHPPVAPEEALDASSPCGLVVCAGLLVIDASDEITYGVLGENLGNPFWDYTLGWLDPIGAHGDYRSRRVVRIMQGLGAAQRQAAQARSGSR